MSAPRRTPPAIASLAAVIMAVTVSACGSESPPPPDASKADSTAIRTSPTSTSTAPTSPKPAPSASASASSSASASAAPVALAPSDENVGKLLDGGASLEALPTRATDDGKPFDPALRGKLAPSRPKAGASAK